MASKIRLYGGKHANRVISFLEEGVRPSGARVRTVLFDWLRPYIRGSHCIDLFAGSGVLGFEALSQGAASVLAIDVNPNVCKQISTEAERIGEDKLRCLALKVPCGIEEQFDIAFMDPPFQEKALYRDTMVWLRDNHIVRRFLYVESDEKLESMDGWRLLKQKKVSSVWMHLYQRETDD